MQLNGGPSDLNHPSLEIGQVKPRAAGHHRPYNGEAIFRESVEGERDKTRNTYFFSGKKYEYCFSAENHKIRVSDVALLYVADCLTSVFLEDICDSLHRISYFLFIGHCIC